nr:MAG TPA: hypothetical protein [Caudoviricetes sp.]
MERLTVKTGVYQNGKLEIIVGMKCGVEFKDILDRLAAYEDTMLEPEEVADFDRLVKLYLEAGLDKQFVLACIEATKAGMTIDRLHELAQADKEGRCVVLPCKIGGTVYSIRHERVPDDDYRMSFHTEMRIVSQKFGLIHADCIGKSVFLTREAAEAALRRERDG